MDLTHATFSTSSQQTVKMLLLLPSARRQMLLPHSGLNWPPWLPPLRMATSLPY